MPARIGADQRIDLERIGRAAVAYGLRTDHCSVKQCDSSDYDSNRHSIIPPDLRAASVESRAASSP
jgi:hypothetical protein